MAGAVAGDGEGLARFSAVQRVLGRQRACAQLKSEVKRQWQFEAGVQMILENR